MMDDSLTVFENPNAQKVAKIERLGLLLIRFGLVIAIG